MELQVKLAKAYFKTSKIGLNDKLAKSKQMVEEVLREDKDNPDAQYVMAKHLTDDNKIDEAIELMETCTKTDESTENSLFLGQLYQKKKLYRKS